MIRRQLLTLAALAVAFVATAGTNVRADFTFSVTATDTGVNPQGQTILELGPVPSGGPLNEALSPTFIFANPQVASSAEDLSPDTVNFGYEYTIEFFESPGGLSLGTVAITGNISGTASAGGSNLTNTFTSAIVPTQAQPEGAFPLFVAVVQPGNAPQVDPTGATSVGSFSVKVTAIPEPTSIALMGIGGLGALSLFRRRKAQA